MRYSFTLLLSLCFSLLPVQQAASTEASEEKPSCDAFFQQYDTPAKRLQAYVNERKAFIQYLQLGQYQEGFQDLLSNTSNLQDDALPLNNLVDLVHKHYEDVPYKTLGVLEGKIDHLEEAADCFDTGKRSDQKVMRFIRHSKAKTEDPYIGFPLRKTKGSGSSGQVLVTSASRCHESESCEFSVLDRSDLDKDFILLTHHTQQTLSDDEPEAEPEDSCTETTTGCVKLPSRIFVDRVDLKETLEWFGQPDIVLIAQYFLGDEEVAKPVLITLPWVIKKGLNFGHTQIIKWPNADRVTLTLIEKNWNLSTRSIYNTALKIFSVIKIAYGAYQYDPSVVHSAIKELIDSPSKEDPDEEDIFDTLDQLTDDQVMAATTFHRVVNGAANTTKEVVLKNTEGNIKAKLQLVYESADIGTPNTTTGTEPNRDEL
ncbi:hypothetical protein EOPP23_07520 [Endozoicomonas sp. OPT23]|nr:hypothetical protein [Endozoicomonas sp. OPT23]